MKRCPWCAEEIQDEAIKCRFCGEMVSQSQGLPWHFRTGSMFLAFLMVGPFMLPLVWLHPTMSRGSKTLYSSIIGVISVVLTWISIRSIQRIIEYYKILGF